MYVIYANGFYSSVAIEYGNRHGDTRREWKGLTWGVG